MANEVTAQRAAEYKLPPQGEHESDIDFRQRVAGAIRAVGGPSSIIEAHEAQTNRLYDDPGEHPLDDPMNGIMGALAQALHGVDYHPHDGVDMVGNDMALGTVILHKDPSAEALLLAVMLDDAERRPRR